MKREAEFGRLFRHWIKAHPMDSAAFELKQTTSDSLPFDDVQEHQLDALAAANGSGILYKIPDDSRGVKPFDMVYLRFANSWVVIRYPKFFCIIDAERFVLEKKQSERKSLTSARAREIAFEIVLIA